jgi:Fe2+ or Zn2+ uptake regulation protein
VSEQPHSTAVDIDTAVRAAIGAISLQAVYDALATLTDKGIIRRIQPAGSPARYEERVGDNQHNLICRTCGRMVDTDCAGGYAPCLTAHADSDYEIDEAEVIYWGRCPECVAASAVVADGCPQDRATCERGRAARHGSIRPGATTDNQPSNVNPRERKRNRRGCHR